MDEIHFYCVICGKSMSAHATSAGGFADCPECLRIVPIPGFPARPGHPAECSDAFSSLILGIEIKFLCERCGQKLQVDARRQGRTLECPVCHEPTKVPEWAGALPPVPPVEEPARRTVAPLVRLSAEECEFLSAPMQGGGQPLLSAGTR